MDRKHCAGCRQDFYNGNNDLGIEECWHLKDARLVSALDIPIDLRPPYRKMKPRSRPHCWQGKGVVRVTKDALDSRGYWKA